MSTARRAFACRQWPRCNRRSRLQACRQPARSGTHGAAAFALFLRHDARLRRYADYSAQLVPEDRWAVAAYIRALQLSQAATQSDVPSGVQVKDLKEIAKEKNLPEGFATPWPLPGTAVQAYPPIAKEGTPGMAPANPADPQSRFRKQTGPAAAQ